MALPSPTPAVYPRDNTGLQALREDILFGNMTQSYGHTGFENFHDGVDIVLPYANQWHQHPPVHAPISGRVVAAGWDNSDPTQGYGRKVEIENGQGYRVMVGHLNDYYQSADPNRGVDYGSALHVGDLVYAGDTIGHEDSSGWSTGPHVHYRIHDPNGRSLDPTLGAPPTSGHDDYRARTNVFYAFDHSMGFGAGDNVGTQKWVTAPPPPLVNESRIYEYGNPPKLSPNPGNPYGQPAQGPPSTDPAPTPVPVNSCSNCPQGWECLPCVNGTTSQGGVCAGAYICTPGAGAQGQTCYTTPWGSQVCVPTDPVGGVSAAIQKGIMTAGLALVGLVFIAAGLLALNREGPVNAVTAPVIQGTKAVARVASVAA